MAILASLEISSSLSVRFASPSSRTSPLFGESLLGEVGDSRSSSLATLTVSLFRVFFVSSTFGIFSTSSRVSSTTLFASLRSAFSTVLSASLPASFDSPLAASFAGSFSTSFDGNRCLSARNFCCCCSMYSRCCCSSVRPNVHWVCLSRLFGCSLSRSSAMISGSVFVPCSMRGEC